MPARIWTWPSRFTDYNGCGFSPFLSAVTAPTSALANGGRYSGITFMPAENLRLRAGAAVSSERLDRFPLDVRRARPVGWADL